MHYQLKLFHEGSMALTYIFGHRNPDTDSVCASIALSYLRNELGGKTVPKVIGDFQFSILFHFK